MKSSLLGAAESSILWGAPDKPLLAAMPCAYPEPHLPLVLVAVIPRP